MQSMQDSEALWPLVRQHPRTQAEVARAIFSNMMTGAAVTYPAMLVVAWLYWGTVNTTWLVSLIGWILLVQTCIVLHWWHYQKHLHVKTLAQDWTWFIRHLKQAGVLSMLIVAGISGLAVVIAQARIEAAAMIASVMVLTYLVGSTIADFIHRSAVIAYPVILLTPIGLLHATSGNPAQWAIAVFFLFYFAGVLSYSSMYSKRLQLSIYQRFQLDDIARKLESERERAQAALDAKARFFAATSHDVRQPLQAMSIMLDALRAQGDDVMHRTRLIHDLDVNMDALRALFDQVLQVTRLEAGTVQLQPRAVHLNELFSRLQARFAMQALNSNIELKFCFSQATVLADSLALERMVANLLGNALKHTPSGGKVWVGWRAQRSTLEVRDSGAGIALDQQQRIFDEFYQIDKTGDHTQGLGLGLAIVKRLTALGGQEVGVRSALGRGSTFWLKLTAVQDLHDHKPKISQTAVADKLAPRTTQPQLLYVENDATLLRLTTSLLRMNDWQVHAFADADEALQWLRTGVACDLLLADFRLSQRWDGAQLIEAARALAGRGRLPAIVMTGDGAVAELASMSRLQAAGVDRAPTRLLHKPVKTARLLQVMAECTSGDASSERMPLLNT